MKDFLYEVRRIFKRSIVLIKTIIQAFLCNTELKFAQNIVAKNELSREKVRIIAKSHRKICSINNAENRYKHPFVLKIQSNSVH